MKISPLSKLPRWQPARKTALRNLSRLGREPAHKLLCEVVRGRTRSIAEHARATDHQLMIVARGVLRSLLVESSQQFHISLTEQLDQSPHVTQEEMIRQIAERFPRYKPVINAIPVMATCVPENLKRKLSLRAQTKSIKLVLLLLKSWLR